MTDKADARRCYWGLTWHPAETAVWWNGEYTPACQGHRANVELMRLDIRRLVRVVNAFGRTMTEALERTHRGRRLLEKLGVESQ